MVGSPHGLFEPVSEIFDSEYWFEMRIGLPEFALDGTKIILLFEALDEILLMFVGPLLIDIFDCHFCFWY